MLVTRAFTKPVTNVDLPVFTLIGNNAYGVAAFLSNNGTPGIITYRWQESIDNATWTDIALATAVLNPGETKLDKIVSTRPNVRLMAYAPGGSQLFAGIAQFHVNSSGMQPILNI